MKLNRLCILILTSFVLASCGPSFSSYEEYRNAGERLQLEVISSLLETKSIIPKNKFVIQYINLMLTQADRYRQLETLIATPDFAAFFEESVVLLYYSYSPENLKWAPKEVGQITRDFIVRSIPYSYSYGSDKFRAFLKGMVDEYEDDVFIYDLTDGKHPEEEWTDSNIAFMKNLLHILAWDSEHFTYREFKHLTIFEQSQVLRGIWWANIISKGGWEENSGETLDMFQEEWQTRGKEYLETQSLKTLADETLVQSVSDNVIQVIKDRYGI